MILHSKNHSHTLRICQCNLELTQSCLGFIESYLLKLFNFEEQRSSCWLYLRAHRPFDWLKIVKGYAP